MPTTSSSYNLLYSFKGSHDGQDGNEPTSGLLDVNGTFYGTTSIGGDPSCYGFVNGCGTVYTITSAGVEHVFHRFKLPGGVNPDNAGLIRVGNTLYGVTAGGGNGACGGTGCGTVFSLTLSGQEKTLHNFQGSHDGQQPIASLVYANSRLYGVTLGGGEPHHYGTVFQVRLGGKEGVLHAFQGGKDGENPSSALVNLNGTLYGTTGPGGGARWCAPHIGTDGCGTIYSVSKSGTVKVLYRFKGGRDGAYPQDSMTYLNGAFYGTTYDGGFESLCPGGCGTVFEFNPSTNQERVIYRFKGGADGIQPVSGLLAFRAELFGTTAFGGTGNMGPCSIYGGTHCGTIFKVTTTGTETVLHNFEGPRSDGNRPWTARLLEVNGTLYGTTALGGSHCYPELGCGTVFAITP